MIVNNIYGGTTITINVLNLTVQANAALPIQYIGGGPRGATFPLEVLLPMHLVGYNRNLRKLLLYGNETSLPAAIVAWLLQGTQYSTLFKVVQSAS